MIKIKKNREIMTVYQEKQKHVLRSENPPLFPDSNLMPFLIFPRRLYI